MEKYLIRQLASMAHDEGADFVVRDLQLLKQGNDEHGSLAHTALCLANDVHAEDSLRDALVLNCRRGSRRAGWVSGIKKAVTAMALYSEWSPSTLAATPRHAKVAQNDVCYPGEGGAAIKSGRYLRGSTGKGHSITNPTRDILASKSQREGRKKCRRRTFGRVLEAAVHDGAQQLRLEEEVPETRLVNAGVRAAPARREGRTRGLCGGAGGVQGSGREAG